MRTSRRDTAQRHECSSVGSGPAPPAAHRPADEPDDGAVRPPSPPRAASHRRGKHPDYDFRDLGILPETAEALEAVGIISPFPIQEMTLPVALSGTDVIGQAKTGTGKTLGFGLPLLERVTVPADVEAGRAKPEQLTDAPQALVVVPTRELCQQVTNDLLTAGKVRNVRVLAIYGGRAYEPQVEALKKGVDVVVGTPGRLLDLAGQKKLEPLATSRRSSSTRPTRCSTWASCPTSRRSSSMLPAKRQTMLFSATMPGAVIGLARRYMSQPTHIRATAPDDEGADRRATPRSTSTARTPWTSRRWSRASCRPTAAGLAMVFCRTKRTAADIADQLAAARLRLRRGPRRPRPGRPRAGAARLPQRQGGRPGLHRRRRPRYRRRGRDARHQLPVPRGGEDLPAPHRPYRPRGRQGHRGHARRLGRHPALAADQQGAGPGVRRPGGDVLHLAAPLRGAEHPRGHQGCAAAHRAHPGRAGRRRGRGPRRDRRPRPWPPQGRRRRRGGAPRAHPYAAPAPPRPVAARRRTAPPPRPPKTGSPAAAEGTEDADADRTASAAPAPPYPPAARRTRRRRSRPRPRPPRRPRPPPWRPRLRPSPAEAAPPPSSRDRRRPEDTGTLPDRRGRRERARGEARGGRRRGRGRDRARRGAGHAAPPDPQRRQGRRGNGTGSP